MKTSRHISTNTHKKKIPNTVTKTATKILDIKAPIAIQMALHITPASFSVPQE
jgi:hypothetical protein